MSDDTFQYRSSSKSGKIYRCLSPEIILNQWDQNSATGGDTRNKMKLSTLRVHTLRKLRFMIDVGRILSVEGH